MLSVDSFLYSQIETNPAKQANLTIARTRYVPYGKRIFDVSISLLVIVSILIWLIPVLALLIRATSPGPALFLQTRTGRNGRVFRCMKLRTMYHQENPVFRQATTNDPRITPLGSFLRRTNLDEMPQFLNVLLGDMSLVGPRPHAIQDDSQYWFSLTDYAQRYTVRPGITGLAQVRGARGETDKLIKMKHRLRYDLYYIKRQSLVFDLMLCWLTVMSMLKSTSILNQVIAALPVRAKNLKSKIGAQTNVSQSL
ncbi:sugar transferase [Spirosoma radiotolerans]|uniref:sugar transferase n=1 Tax=Spirosoma radiotolerans TaxID=1379870 RepID=UPI0009E63A35|nr:sugar transferase [Spirosoma radiotolerans]